jgi:putative ABC transport system substrate-binding protein
MKRRAFILGLSAALAGLSKALAQRNLRVVGIWWSPLQVREILIPYKARLAELGWMEGRNVRFEARAWDGDTANMRKQADELVAMHPDVIVALSNPAVAILKPVSGSLPIVFGMVADPAGSGFIQNLARPGGNITGFTNFEPSMGGLRSSRKLRRQPRVCWS